MDASSRSAYIVQGQPDLKNETLSQKKEKKKREGGEKKQPGVVAHRSRIQKV